MLKSLASDQLLFKWETNKKNKIVNI
jgi:hypothetical protein